ncbi:MAG: methyltransferase domain-containing protein [Waterburya sp.]
MTVTTSQPRIGITSRLVKIFLSIKPLANFAKTRARQRMIKRAEAIGVPWQENVKQLGNHNWDSNLAAIQNPNLSYPDYYTTSFHAYDEGNLSWKAAWEVESAARAVHAKIWSDGDINGDSMLRQSYHEALLKQLSITPSDILDLGCGVGMSTLALQEVFPQAQITGVDLSPYFLSVAQYRGQENKHESKHDIKWVHAAAESTDFPDNSVDLVSACLMFHELPTTAAQAIIKEAHRLLRPGGYLAIMDMNPQSEVYKRMPPYILTLLKSTEPYLDQYFALDMRQVFTMAGFTNPSISVNSPRHRTIVARVA